MISGLPFGNTPLGPHFRFFPPSFFFFLFTSPAGRGPNNIIFCEIEGPIDGSRRRDTPRPAVIVSEAPRLDWVNQSVSETLASHSETTEN
ncbi:hypothetical protein CDAR_164091 [Caerostris darwini]|uniref:Secreted protein n=1 Tax=Caerostris darwini TaxID=1538125 RepID=A0AAV4U9T7_9ARAC|nr:hypothetical protein CDAR_164091 [Caerostris darwini]